MKFLILAIALFLTACEGDTVNEEPRELIEGDEHWINAETPQDLEDQLAEYEINVNVLVVRTEMFCSDLHLFKVVLETYHVGTANTYKYYCIHDPEPDAGAEGGVDG